MNPPFVLSDDGDVALFESIEDLERYVESPDVSGYRLFDADGQIITLAARPSKRSKHQLIGVVSVDRVTASESHISQITELEELLRGFLTRVTGKLYDKNALPELLEILQATIGYTQ